MNIMNSKPLAIFQAAMLGILLAQTDRAFGQAEERPTRAQLERIQRTFLIYIQDGENEYQNATNRHAHAIKLWQNNVAKAQFRLDETFTLMDGNQKLKGHQAQIGALRTFWALAKPAGLRISPPIIWPCATGLMSCRTNSIRSSTNWIRPVKALLSDISKKIHDSDMPELVAHTNYDDVQNRDLSGKLFSTGSGQQWNNVCHRPPGRLLLQSEQSFCHGRRQTGAPILTFKSRLKRRFPGRCRTTGRRGAQLRTYRSSIPN